MVERCSSCETEELTDEEIQRISGEADELVRVFYQPTLFVGVSMN